jgi:SulP family sulfate permease
MSGATGTRGEIDLTRPGGAASPIALDWLYRFVPALDSLRSYSWATFRADLVAGATVAAVAVPQAMAYAMIAGLRPEYGLYTAIVMTAVGALFDSSKQLINGPTNAICIALLSALAAVPADQKIQAAVLVALMVGIFQTGITLFRLGDLTRYISHAVIVGFTVGAAILLVLDQFKNLLGMKPVDGEMEHFLVRFLLTTLHGGMHGWTTLLGLGSITVILLLRRVNARFGLRLPELLLPLGIAALVVQQFRLDQHGVAIVGEIPSQLPSFAWPHVEWPLVRQLADSALAIAVLGLLEAIAMAKAIAHQTGQKLDINQQCLSEGFANVAGSFFQCFPGSGSLTRSAINQQAGAMTQWSGVICAALVAATVVFLAPLAYYVPKAALAGILMVSAWRMVDLHQLVYHWRATRFDRRILWITAASAVVISVEFCILIGVFMSFVLYVPRAARVSFTELVVTPEHVIREKVAADPTCTKLLLFNVEGEMFFGSATSLEEQLDAVAARAKDGVRIVVFRLKRARNPDAVCMALLADFVEQMKQRKIEVFLCGVQRDMARALRDTGLAADLGADHIFPEKAGVWSSTLDAVRRAYELLGEDRCETCPRRSDQLPPREAWYYMI